jgi:nucleoid-associated protein YgaU
MTGRELIPWVVLGAGVVSVAVALACFYGPSLTSPPAAEQVPAAQPLVPQAEAPAEPPLKPQAEATGALEPPSKPMTVPTFDVVLIEPSGEGVLAGRAEPGWNVSVESGGTKVAEATADEQGEWSIVLEKPLPAGDHALSLKTTSPDGTRALSSQQTVSAAVAKAETKEVAGLPEAEKPPPPAASEEAPKEPPEAVLAAQSSPSQGQTAEDVPAAPTAPAEAPKPEAAAPAPATHVAEAESGGKPAGAQSAGAGEPSPSPQAPAETSAAPSPAKATIVIRTVDYQDAGADTGKMKLTGASDPGAAIQLYFDDRPFANAIADLGGRWSAETDMKLGAGQHTFRAERYDEATHMMAGQAVVTIERRAPQVAAKAPPPAAATATTPPAASTAPAAPSEVKSRETGPGAAVAAVETGTAEAAPERIVHHKKARPNVYTIRPGDTLWDIAKRYLGGGWRYASIYHGNRHVIRDPDEILPQQKVKLPKR